MRIVLGISGGIAAYKAAELARLLIRNGHEVQAVMTRAAEEFVRPLTFASLTGRKVITDIFSSASPDATLSSAVEHIGVADDFLSTMYLAFRGPVVLAPAMNNNMWEHPATRANLEILKQRGHLVVDPDDGFLACGTYGPGRLAENEKIVAAVERAGLRPAQDFAGETVLITAGPTQEPLDPVRYLTNRSSGKMGYAIAAAALERGARVILVSGPVNIVAPAGASVIRIRTAREMRDAVFANLEPATVIVKCAAVADFRPASEAAQKIKKTGASVSLELEPTADILAELGQKRGSRVLVGFAAETENLAHYARLKLETKKCDMVVANLVSGEEPVFDSDSNEVLLALRTGELAPLARASKREIAGQILDHILKLKR